MTTERSEGAMRAGQVLETYYGDVELIPLPVNPVFIARDMGVNVYETRMSNEVSGLITREQHGGGVDIFLNESHAPVRQRFTCAHEIGHYMDLLDRGQAERPFFKRRDQRSSCGTVVEEIYANQFAAYLLMPPLIVRSMNAGGWQKLRMARELGVSLDAISLHLENLRL